MATRQTKRRTARAVRRSSNTGRRVFVWALLILVGLGVIGLIVMSRRDLATRAQRPDPPPGTESFDVTSKDHSTEPLVYEQTPPVGGDHAPMWQNCGFYSEPIASEPAVHALEHGAIWVTYRSDLPEDEVGRLRDLSGSRSHILVSPWPGDLQSPIVASAWGNQIQLESARDERLDQFVRAFRIGPQAPEPGGSCSNGVGVPE